MSYTKRYLVDLTYRIIDATKECDPYEHFDSEEAFDSTFNSLINDLAGLISYFRTAVEDIPTDKLSELFPCTAAVLEELEQLYEEEISLVYADTVFSIKPEYLENFGSEADEDTRLTIDDVAFLAKEWNVPLCNIIENQLIAN